MNPMHLKSVRVIRFLVLPFLTMGVVATTGCSGQVGTGGSGDESDSQEIVSGDRSAESAIVGQKAKVTATSLNLRTGPSTSAAIIAVMPDGSVVDVTATSSGWYKVNWSGKTGWCSGAWLVPVAGNGGGNNGGGTPVDKAIARAESGVGFSYHWGAGCWDPAGGASHGACYGSCPNCSHAGQWGADCSGYVAKIWQVPGASALTSCSHPYSTYNFRFTTDHWSPVPRSSARRGDAFVHHESGSGHMFIYDHGDAWGTLVAYEAKGCSYGIVHDSRTAGSNYIVVRREGF